MEEMQFSISYIIVKCSNVMFSASDK